MNLLKAIANFFSSVADNFNIMKNAKTNGYIVHSIIRDGDGLTLAYVTKLGDGEGRNLLSSHNLTVRGSSLYGAWVAIN